MNFESTNNVQILLAYCPKLILIEELQMMFQTCNVSIYNGTHKCNIKTLYLT